MNEACPYCGNNIKQNAFVCAPCGAYKAEIGLSQSDRQFLFIGGLHWLIFGPLFIVVGIFGGRELRDGQGIVMFLCGCAVTAFGIWVLRKMLKRASVVIWKRKF